VSSVDNEFSNQNVRKAKVKLLLEHNRQQNVQKAQYATARLSQQWHLRTNNLFSVLFFLAKTKSP
jgi:hypothetical protein